MSPLYALRLCLDLLAAGLLTFGLSYWWLGDVAHEVAGIAMFALLVAHNVFNRRWYGRATKMPRNPASAFGSIMTAMLLLSVALLLVTSAVLATFLPEWVSPDTSGIAARAHVLAAYWAFVLVAMHLGLRWPMLMGIARRLLRIERPSRMRTIALRLAAGFVAAFGVRSFAALQFGARLTNRVSLDWWNFDETVLGFFAHCAAVAGLLIAVGHYAAALLRRSSGPSGRGHSGRKPISERKAAASRAIGSKA